MLFHSCLIKLSKETFICCIYKYLICIHKNCTIYIYKIVYEVKPILFINLTLYNYLFIYIMEFNVKVLYLIEYHIVDPGQYSNPKLNKMLTSLVLNYKVP